MMTNCTRQVGNSDEANHHFPDVKALQKSSADKKDL